MLGQRQQAGLYVFSLLYYHFRVFFFKEWQIFFLDSILSSGQEFVFVIGTLISRQLELVCRKVSKLAHLTLFQSTKMSKCCTSFTTFLHDP
jgi:hypothetical protein